MMIADSEVEKNQAAVKESSRSHPSTTLFDPIPPPRLSRLIAAKRGRKQGREDAGHAGQEGKEAAVIETGLDAMHDSYSSPLPLRPRLRSGKGHQLPRVSRTAAASKPQQSTTPFLCLLAGGQHTDALANIVAFVHGIKRGHANMDAALKGSLGLICKATRLALEGTLVVYSLPDAHLVCSSSSSASGPSKAKKEKQPRKPPRCSPSAQISLAFLPFGIWSPLETCLMPLTGFGARPEYRPCRRGY